MRLFLRISHPLASDPLAPVLARDSTSSQRPKVDLPRCWSSAEQPKPTTSKDEALQGRFSLLAGINVKPEELFPVYSGLIKISRIIH